MKKMWKNEPVSWNFPKKKFLYIEPTVRKIHYVSVFNVKLKEL